MVVREIMDRHFPVKKREKTSSPGVNQNVRYIHILFPTPTNMEKGDCLFLPKIKPGELRKV